MKNFKKILALLLAAVLLIAGSVAATLAFLTKETTIKHNVFTAGQVNIELTEEVDGETYGGVTSDVNGGKYDLIAPGDELTKEVTVKNTGTIPAYVSVTVNLNKAAEIAAAIDGVYANAPYSYGEAQMQAIYDQIFEGWMLQYNTQGMTPTNALPTALRVDTAKTDAAGVATYAEDNWFKNYESYMSANELQYTYYLYLEPGKSNTLFTGINVPEYFTSEQMAMFNGLEIDIQGAAIQAENFATPQEAFAQLRAEQDGTAIVAIPVSDAATLADLTAAGGNVALEQNISLDAQTTAPYGNKYGIAQNGGVIDGQGNKLDIDCYGDDYGIMTTGGTIKNLIIEEGCRAIMAMYPTEDLIIDNVKIGGDGVLYPINTGESANVAGLKLIVTNSEIRGWTSYGNGTFESASFTNCTFGQGTYYNNIYGRVLKPYVTTTITDCSFVRSMCLDLSELGNGQKIIFTNCTVDGQPVTASVFTIPTTDAQYDTELFTVDLPSWATSIEDCIVFN